MKDPEDSRQPTEAKKVRRVRKQKLRQISVNLSPDLVDKIDQAAAQDYTTRSEIMRAAILWYLRPQARGSGRSQPQTDPQAFLKTLQHRKRQVSAQELAQELGRSYED